MKLSIVIVCWNDLGVIRNCLESIFATVRETNFEVPQSLSSYKLVDGNAVHLYRVDEDSSCGAY